MILDHEVSGTKSYFGKKGRHQKRLTEHHFLKVCQQKHTFIG